MSNANDDTLTGAQLDSLRELLLAKRDEVQQGLEASRNDSRPVGLDVSIGRLTRANRRGGVPLLAVPHGGLRQRVRGRRGRSRGGG
jgi:hypothetical protein